MKLSILIPTHNRPVLFNRCINSVIPFLTDDIEVIVNNDSNDITEIRHPSIKYYYNKFDNISLIYKFLIEFSKGKYVYYLEDDDYLTREFFNIVLEKDIIVGNYYPTYNPSYIIKCMSLYKDAMLTTAEFLGQLNLYHLQLSQFIFHRDSIEDFVFPMDNNIYNDINLVLHAVNKSKEIKTLNKIIFYQTIDGKDNISFPESDKSISIDKSFEFMKKYEDFYKKNLSNLW